MELYNDDCLKIMPQITDKSIDMILCDLPYGVTHNKWDSVIPFDKLWEQYNRIIKDLSLIHISEPTRRTPISYAVFCLKKKKHK